MAVTTEQPWWFVSFVAESCFTLWKLQPLSRIDRAPSHFAPEFCQCFVKCGKYMYLQVVFSRIRNFSRSPCLQIFKRMGPLLYTIAFLHPTGLSKPTKARSGARWQQKRQFDSQTGLNIIVLLGKTRTLTRSSAL